MVETLVEVHRGPVLESQHRGHAVVWKHGTGVIGAWGTPDMRILPRSASKMIQALPLVESGAAKGLTTERLALSCASHNGAAIHTDRVTQWLSDLGLSEDALRCGPQEPADISARDGLILSQTAPDQSHNNCSGKHCGFLTLGRHLGAGAEYIDPDHPVQRAVAEAWDGVTDDANPDFAIDGCSAPNFVTRLDRLAFAMAGFAAAQEGQGARAEAMVTLRTAMMAHPELVAGEGRACTRLMRAMDGRAAVKTGAEGVFTGILPGQGIGIALKIEDGTTRAAEAVMAALLVACGVLDGADPVAQALTHGPITNRRDVVTGHLRVVDSITDWRP